MKDIPNDRVTFVCDHVFSDMNLVKSVSMVEDGNIAAGCGCDFSSAHVIGFGHIKSKFPRLMEMPVITERSYYERDFGTEKWKLGIEDTREN